MLEAVHGPACFSRGAGAALGNPVSDIAVRAILMPCTLMFAKDICADACCIVSIWDLAVMAPCQRGKMNSIKVQLVLCTGSSTVEETSPGILPLS